MKKVWAGGFGVHDVSFRRETPRTGDCQAIRIHLLPLCRASPPRRGVGYLAPNEGMPTVSVSPLHSVIHALSESRLRFTSSCSDFLEACSGLRTPHHEILASLACPRSSQGQFSEPAGAGCSDPRTHPRELWPHASTAGPRGSVCHRRPRGHDGLLQDEASIRMSAYFPRGSKYLGPCSQKPLGAWFLGPGTSNIGHLDHLAFFASAAK